MTILLPAPDIRVQCGASPQGRCPNVATTVYRHPVTQRRFRRCAEHPLAIGMVLERCCAHGCGLQVTTAGDVCSACGLADADPSRVVMGGGL